MRWRSPADAAAWGGSVRFLVRSGWKRSSSAPRRAGSSTRPAQKGWEVQGEGRRSAFLLIALAIHSWVKQIGSASSVTRLPAPSGSTRSSPRVASVWFIVPTICIFRAPVALKCLKIPDELTAEERHEFLEQFRSEAEIMFRLSASLPNIVRPLHVDAVQAPTGEFVPADGARSGSKGEASRRSSRSAALRACRRCHSPRTLELLGPAADALDAAHHFEESRCGRFRWCTATSSLTTLS